MNETVDVAKDIAVPSLAVYIINYKGRKENGLLVFQSWHQYRSRQGLYLYFF